MRRWLLLAAASTLAHPSHAQQQPIAYVPTEGASLSGSLAVENGRASIGNNGTVTAGDKTVRVSLARGGDLSLCASTTVHLSRDASINSSDPAADSALMIALDRGAIEASYKPGKYSDVLLTPDLRILISGPGQSDLKIRVNQKGDTCIDNHGANAPYVTVTSQFEGGLYRVQPNQRILIEHGSLQQVVDNEPELCGCPVPPPVSVASAVPGMVTSHANPAQPGQTIGGPSSTPADTTFPLAVSEGLKPPPPPPSQPVVPAGVAHAEVDAPIAYSGKATPNPAEPGAAGNPPPAVSSSPLPAAAGNPPVSAPAAPAPAGSALAEAASTAVLEREKGPEGAHGLNPITPRVTTQLRTQKAQPVKSGQRGGFFHSLGHFFSRLFGR